MFDAIMPTDASVLLFLQENLRCGALTFVLSFFSKIGEMGAIWLLSGMVFFASRKYRKLGFQVIIAIGVAWGINELVKRGVCRPRPFGEIEGLIVLMENPESWSFPSGHACTGFASAYVFARGFASRGLRRFIWMPYALAAVMSFSRMYLGVHYLSDLIAGAVLGTVFAAVVYAISEKAVKIPEYSDDAEERENDG